MKIGEKIIEIRKKNNLTQEEFAEELFVTRQTVSNWENTKSYPDIETLILMSDKFGYSLDILLREDREMIRTIDKIKKANKMNKKILTAIGLTTILILIVCYISLKAFLLNVYKIENKEVLDKYVSNIREIYLKPNNEETNVTYRGMSLKIPADFKKIDQKEEEIYHLRIDNVDCNQKTYDLFAPREYFESRIVKEPDYENWYGIDGKNLIRLYKGTNTTKNWSFHRRFNPLIFDYKKLMKRYGLKREEDLIDYYRKHANDKLNIFSSISHIQINNMAATYVEETFGPSKENESAAYKLKFDKFDVIVKTNGNFFVAILYKGNEIYNLTLNKDYFDIAGVIEILQSIKIED